MEAAFKKGEKVERPHFGTIENPIAMMEDEHEAAGDIFKEISDLTNNYKLPPNACNTYKALYHKLEEFENDLHLHIHLENNILFPKALAMEKETLS
jgi:regulator of cell morphogenesis and NO signaling